MPTSPPLSTTTTTTTTTATATIQPTPPTELSLPLPLSPHTTLHIQTSRLEACTLTFLTTTTSGGFSSSSGPSAKTLSPLGSFVYAIPNRLSPASPLTTALYTSSGSIDFCTRVARILALKTGRPAYVGCSVSFQGLEEEVEGVRAAVGGVLGQE